MMMSLGIRGEGTRENRDKLDVLRIDSCKEESDVDEK